MKTVEELISQFNEIYKNMYVGQDQCRFKNSKKTFGYFCAYFPAEIVHAAGMLPIRILCDKRKVGVNQLYHFLPERI